MSFIVNIDNNAKDQKIGGFYPEAYNEYVATITNFEAKKAGQYDIIQISTNVESSTGEIYEEAMNGPAIFQGDRFSADISRLILSALNSPENEGTLDPKIGETTSPDLAELIGKKIGVRYLPQKKKPEFATTAGIISTDKVRGLFDEAKYNEWKELKAKAKESGGSSSAPKEKVNPFVKK